MTTAIAEYSATEAALADLAQRYKGVVFDVTSTKGMDEARKARAEIRGYRTSLEAKRKEIKAPALERCRLIDDEAKRITAVLVELEDPIDSIIKSEESRKEAEKEAKAAAERARIAEIQQRIGAIQSAPMAVIGATSARIRELIVQLEAEEISEERFGEFVGPASIAKDAALAQMTKAIAQQLANEAEAERLRLEREEIARKQAEEARQRAEAEAVERARREAEEAAAKAARDVEEARLAAERAELERQRQQLAEQQAAAERAARESREAEERAAREARQAEEAKLQAERDELERQRREVEAERQRQEAEARARREAEERAAEEARIAAQTRTAKLIADINKVLATLTDPELAEVLDFATSITVNHAARAA